MAEAKSAVCVVGSVALDSIETPDDAVKDILGGAGAYFGIAASFFAPVRLVGIIGADFPGECRDFLAERGIDLDGLVEADGPTFRWSGRYHENMNIRDTLDLQLNVFEQFDPELPAHYRSSEFVFLANIQPALQTSVLDQLENPLYVGMDTIDFWINEAHEELCALLSRVDVVSINDSETELLAREPNIVRAARKILGMGPQHLIVKRGEYGALQFAADDVFAVPAYPLESVVDPTGAGDTFAGGMFGSLAESGEVTRESLRRAIVYGSVVASFTVEDFGPRRFQSLTREEIDERYRAFMALTDFQSI